MKQLRICEQDKKHGKRGIITEGHFDGEQGIVDYIRKRGLGETGTFRLEHKVNGTWRFVKNVTIDCEVKVPRQPIIREGIRHEDVQSHL